MENNERKKELLWDVFPGFNPGERLKNDVGEAWVKGITMYDRKRRLWVELESDHIIEKYAIKTLEERLREHVFGGQSGELKIEETFVLSSQYTPKSVYDIYRGSFLAELDDESHVAGRIIRHSEWFFNDGIITLALPDSDIARMMSDAIRDYIVNTYKERFGMEVKVGFDYTEEHKNTLREANERRLEIELREIESRRRDRIEEAGAEEETNKIDKKVNELDDNTAKTAKNNKIDDATKKTTAHENTDASKKNESKKSDRRPGVGKYGKKGGNYDEDCIYGRNVEGDVVDISELFDGIGEVVVRGQVLSLEDRELKKSGKFLLTGVLTDFTDSIVFKLFLTPEDRDPILQDIKEGCFLLIKGVPLYDTYSKEVCISSVVGVKLANDFRKKRMDDSLEKRVELHLHTVYSDMDSVVDVGKVIGRAKEWGMKSIAITDKFGVQAFPVANHCLKKDDDFKIIYGFEAFIVDDLIDFVQNEKGQPLDTEYVVFDIETTGLSETRNKIIEIGAVKVRNGEVVDKFSEFINPEIPIPYHITQLTSITDAMVMNAPTYEELLPKFLDFVGDAIVVAHNAKFDTGFIRHYAKTLGIEWKPTILDTMTIAQVLIPELGSYNLDRLCKQFGVVNAHHHRAVDDADATAAIFVKMIKVIKDRGIDTIAGLNSLGSHNPAAIKKARAKHAIILVKNETGRVNLYRLVSEAHLNYFNKLPKIPKSVINQYREGLLIGSGCSEGEVFQAFLNGMDEDEITRVASFYDYFEIQPVCNNRKYIGDNKFSVNSDEDLQDINRQIVRLGEETGKPVVATGDVHYLDPEDDIYMKIIIGGQPGAKAKEADNLPPVYFRTTEEMLEEFKYLGGDMAKKVVVDNTNLIADMIEKISPVRPDKAPPIIEDSDKTLTDICYNKAHEIYGENLPEIVDARLKKELNSIISNGFAVLYIIAQKLVWKSNEDGYLVGSRGSVGSSFVATMAGITEVNPLPAHYICPECHFVDFDSEQVKKFSGRSGCDMPDCDCPKCGHKLIKEGHDIPFETFLGFKGDKEPDIDLNFSGEYQPRAHAYTEELFGKGKAFRAGTIGTLADKTAYGFVMKYLREHEQVKRHCEMERLAAGCTGVKRTTGQHPGGMIVLPRHEEIYSFTPIQHPAYDTETDIITTHFEYHSIDHNLLKLDILGHDDPTMIRRLEDLTGVDAKTIPLDDPDVMSLFHNTEALKIEPEDIGGTQLGTLGIPEFGTDFAMQMLIDTNPQGFSDLVRIAGLSHGTDVWLGNAETLIKEGTCLLADAICTRDDIMTYLIYKGLEPGTAFKIMENVRKGNVARGKCKEAWEEWVKDMKAHDVPDWYIWSCNKIQYMFPKAHAAAYVMMAWRIAWFKVRYPLAYYTAFYSIRASGFDYKLMCFGKEKLEENMAEYAKIPKEEQTATIKDTIKDMRLVQEMYARGIEFMPIDLYKAKADRFQIIDGKIMPSLSSIAGLGPAAAVQLEEAAKKGEFLSREEIRDRAKVSKTSLDDMAALGILGDIPETNQYSLFGML
ncbi:MAG: PolC-type DNA polymerase III [Lachnospiraceae bacterium]|nr:PolC-type DNA polymerase III [Lachnospiraceae bacterium]